MSKSTRWTLEDIRSKGLSVAGERIAEKPKQKSANPTAKERYQALGRMKAGRMNQTEKNYAAHLEARKLAGEVVEYWFEPMNLRLADKCFYRVDFLVMLKTGELEAREVKGFWTDDALVKIKVAAEMFPFRFVAIQYKKGEWVEREF